MLKRNITYTTFDGDEVTETFYFNLTKTELIELQASVEGGVETLIERIVEARDNKEMIEQFKRIILLAYGERSEDGKRFIKSEEMSKDFSQTAAFDALFMDLAMNEQAAADFISGIVPRDLAEQIDKAFQNTADVTALDQIRAADASTTGKQIPPPPPGLPKTQPL